MRIHTQDLFDIQMEKMCPIVYQSNFEKSAKYQSSS